MSIRRHELRLSKTFRHLVLMSLASGAAAAATAACSSSSSGARGSADAGSDAGTAVDAGGDGTMPGVDGGGDTSTTDAPSTQDGPSDAGTDSFSCKPSAPYLTDASYLVAPDATTGSPACNLGMAPAYYFVDYPCGVPDAATEQCNFTFYTCALPPKGVQPLCTPFPSVTDSGIVDCLLEQGAGCNDGSIVAQPGQPVTVQCGICAGAGRRPAGLRRARPRRGATLEGELLAHVSRLEAASVVAFERLHDDLAALGAPAPLARAARRAARDEVRHATATARLAARFGSSAPEAPRVCRASERRSLAAIARENAVEGCVRETFGALVATWQAAHAQDPAVRSAMERIATDETRHAALAWAVASWAERKLDARSRERLRRARTRAVQTLAADPAFALPAAARAMIGLPDAAQARALVDALAGVWS